MTMVANAPFAVHVNSVAPAPNSASSGCAPIVITDAGLGSGSRAFGTWSWSPGDIGAGSYRATLARSEIPRCGLCCFAEHAAEAFECSQIPGAIEVEGETRTHQDGRLSASS